MKSEADPSQIVDEYGEEEFPFQFEGLAESEPKKHKIKLLEIPKELKT